MLSQKVYFCPTGLPSAFCKQRYKMTALSTDTRIEPIDHLGRKPDRDVTLSKRKGLVNDYGVGQGEGQEAKLEPIEYQYTRPQSEGVPERRYIQELPGHSSVKTTMVYTHITPKAIRKIGSPPDQVVDQQKNNSDYH